MELDLKEIRNQLDTIDDQMIALFSQRMQLVAKVAAYKKEVDERVEEHVEEQRREYEAEQRNKRGKYL